MNITIRQATIDDANIIAHAVAMAIGEESVLDYCGNNYIDVLTEIAQYEDSQYSYLNALVAEVDGKSAGAIVGYDGALLEHLRKRTLSIIRKYNPDVVVCENETGAGEFYMDSLGILPEYRGLGIGRKLMIALREKAFNEGHDCVGLMVDFLNPNAERLYLSIDFERVEKRIFFGHDMWHLQSKR